MLHLQCINYLHNNPTEIQNFNLDHCNSFLSHYYNKRNDTLKIVREIVKQHKTNLERNQQLKQKAQSVIIDRLTSCYTHHVIPVMWNTQIASRNNSVRGRNIGNSIFDLPSVFTGYESIASIKMRELHVSKYSPTLEHFKPRQWRGEQIAEMICTMIQNNSELTFHNFATEIYESCFVHKVTKEENLRLVEYQKSHKFISSEQSYHDAGIELVLVAEQPEHRLWNAALTMIQEGNFEHANEINKMYQSVYSIRNLLDNVRTNNTKENREALALQSLDVLEDLAQHNVFV